MIARIITLEFMDSAAGLTALRRKLCERFGICPAVFFKLKEKPKNKSLILNGNSLLDGRVDFFWE
jgi:hypothetical protein